MNPPLKLFTDPATLARTNRTLLTRFLEEHQPYLSPDAATLLQASLNSLNFEEYCAAWAAQFRSANQFRPPLLQALHDIEALASPDNAAPLDDALAHLPPGYEINRHFSTLHQALHLWLLTQP